MLHTMVSGPWMVEDYLVQWARLDADECEISTWDVPLSQTTSGCKSGHKVGPPRHHHPLAPPPSLASTEAMVEHPTERDQVKLFHAGHVGESQHEEESRGTYHLLWGGAY